MIRLTEHLLGTSQFSQCCYYFPQFTTLGKPQFFDLFFLQDLPGSSCLVIFIHLIYIHLFLCYFIQLFRNTYFMGLIEA